MGTENPGRPSFPITASNTPFATTPQTVTPFSASALSLDQASGFRPTMLAPDPTIAPSLVSRPALGSEAPAFRPIQPLRFRDPSSSSPLPSNVPPTIGVYRNFPMPEYSSTPQAPPFQAPPVGQLPFQPPVGQVASTPSFRQSQVPSVPMGSPQQVQMFFTFIDSSFFQPRPNFQPSVPPTVSSYPTSMVTSQPPLLGYAKQFNAVSQPTPLQSPFQAQQGSNVPGAAMASTTPSVLYQGGYDQAPPMAARFGSTDQLQHPGYMPPAGGFHSLAEDFNSLSIGSVLGSIDPGIDAKAFPRPLDGDMESTSLGEAYSMNCNTRYLRLTTSAMPNSRSLASRWHLPLGAIVCPLAEAPDGDEVPVINFGKCGIIRCRRCRTYVNPYIAFTDAGRKWRCNICSLLNDVPGEYFSDLDATGRRVDLDQRPELTRGSVEFVAPTEYMMRPPMPPLYFFLIDVSMSAVHSGMVEIVAQTVKSCLDDLPGFPRTQIGFITYDSTIHFYNMNSSLMQPQMMVVSDLDDIFIPLPDDLLINLSDSRTVVDAFLDSLPSMFQQNMNVESALGPALKSAFMVMSQLGGKLLIFQNTMPSLGVGRLKLRGDDGRVYGTDKEHALRVPEDPFYKQMAADFTKYQIGVNVYAFSDKYIDIASLGTLAKYTGGQVYCYPGFQSTNHGEKLRHELTRDLTRETAWEAVMRIRCGKGIRFTSYHGNFMLRSTDLLALPVPDCDKAYAMQLSLEETLLTNQTVYFQVALLYTASCGERRIRVHTAAAPVVSDLGEMYRHADTGAIVSLFSRLAIEKTLSHKLEDARNSLQLRIVKALREYRNLHASVHRLGGRMIYPESLKFLPLYGLALCKSVPLRGGYPDVQLDERCAAGFTMMALPVKKLLKLLYPSLIRLDDNVLKASVMSDEFKSIMKRLPLTADSLDSRGLYIYDNGFHFVVWFGRMLLPDIAMNLLGPDAAADLSRATVCERDTEMSRNLMGILKKLRKSDPSYYQLCHLVRQGQQPREGFLLLMNLLEDQISGTNGYIDWMLHLHRQVQQNA